MLLVLMSGLITDMLLIKLTLQTIIHRLLFFKLRFKTLRNLYPKLNEIVFDDKNIIIVEERNMISYIR